MGRSIHTAAHPIWIKGLKFFGLIRRPSILILLFGYPVSIFSLSMGGIMYKGGELLLPPACLKITWKISSGHIFVAFPSFKCSFAPAAQIFVLTFIIFYIEPLKLARLLGGFRKTKKSLGRILQTLINY